MLITASVLLTIQTIFLLLIKTPTGLVFKAIPLTFLGMLAVNFYLHLESFPNCNRQGADVAFINLLTNLYNCLTCCV